MSYVPNYPPASTYDLPSEVDAAKNISISHGDMQFKVNKDGVITPYQSFICRFHNSLSKYIVDYNLDENEFNQYYQKPKLFCQDIYGTPELWSSLLYINNMVSTCNFTQRKIKAFTTGIIEALQEIMTIYSDDIETNKNEVYPK